MNQTPVNQNPTSEDQWKELQGYPITSCAQSITNGSSGLIWFVTLDNKLYKKMKSNIKDTEWL